ATTGRLNPITSDKEFDLGGVEDDSTPDKPDASDGLLPPSTDLPAQVPIPANPQTVSMNTALNILEFFVDLDVPGVTGTTSREKKCHKVCKTCIKIYGNNKEKIPQNVPNYIYGPSTVNMNLCCHLYKVHPQDYNKAIVKNKWNYKLLTQTNNTSQLIHFIVADDQSICVIECPEFCQLCMILQETLVNADIPGCDKMREAVLNQWWTLFEESKLKLSASLNVFTADIWSNANLAAYLALTSHWISQDKSTGHLTIKAALIGFYRIKKRHTSVNIANTILELLDRADVTLKIGHFTLDNTKNNAVAMQELEHQLNEHETAIVVGFDHRNNCVRCYAHIINICSSHIVASMTSTPKLYIFNLKVPIDSNIVTCDDNDDNNKLDGDLDCVIKDLELDDCYNRGNHPWLTRIKRNPLQRAQRVIHLLCSSDQCREGFHMFICDGNQHNWFTAKDCDGKRAPVQVPELQPLRDVKIQWDSVYMMLQHLRELRPVRSSH
ncbi:hypothetical protein V8E53_002623, partial [Lactarius tabidus]